MVLAKIKLTAASFFLAQQNSLTLQLFIICDWCAFKGQSCTSKATYTTDAPLVTLHSPVHFGFAEPSHYKWKRSRLSKAIQSAQLHKKKKTQENREKLKEELKPKMVLISYSWDGATSNKSFCRLTLEVDWLKDEAAILLATILQMIKKKRSMWKKIYELEKGFKNESLKLPPATTISCNLKARRAKGLFIQRGNRGLLFRCCWGVSPGDDVSSSSGSWCLGVLMEALQTNEYAHIVCKWQKRG